MLSSVLLHLDGASRQQAAIEIGVRAARRAEARLRGVTLLDTRRVKSLVSTCEAAGYAREEYRQLHQAEQQQGAARSQLSQACLSAGVDFDVRCVRGNPLEVLPAESAFHDLVVTAYAPPGSRPEWAEDLGLSAKEVVDLLFRGVQPMLVVRDEPQELNRVLLVYDGTIASGKAIRSFLSQNLLPGAEYRLLAIGNSEARARESLREMVDYCRARRVKPETGSLCGSLRRVLVPYAEKWQADLVVLGVARGNRVLRRIFGETAQDVLRKTGMALYATA